MRWTFLTQKVIDLFGLERETWGDLPQLFCPYFIKMWLEWNVIGEVELQICSWNVDQPSRDGSRADISMAVHQRAHFNKSPMLSHEMPIIRITRYLVASKDCEVVFKPNK